MNGGRTAPKLKERRRVGFGGIPLDTPPLAAGSFIFSINAFNILTSHVVIASPKGVAISFFMGLLCPPHQVGGLAIRNYLLRLYL
jgi:hypothetical protein